MPLLTSLQLPDPFIARMQSTLGVEFTPFIESLKKESPVSIRLNSRKNFSTEAIIESVGWAKNAAYLPQRPTFALDPQWHAGSYYVQEASSMFLEQVWNAIAPQLDSSPVALDLCAAPGGKSTHLASLLPQGGVLVANEVIRARAHILAENVTKWGTGNVIITNSDPRDFGNLEGVFDLIVIDAPCSGEGMFRKDPDAVKEWSEANVQLCAERQRRIVADVWDALKPGGFMVYSTCTYNLYENEQILQWISENYTVQGMDITVSPEWNIEVSDTNGIKGYRFYPHCIKGEGLFMAVIQKADGRERSFRRPKKPTWSKASRKEIEIVSDWILENSEWEWLRWQEKMIVLPAGTYDLAEQVAQSVRIVQAGADVAEIIREQANPLSSLALFTKLNQHCFPVEDVDLERALRFLKKEDIPLTEGKGWKLITYQQTPLGWVKQIGHRANNYFPNEWRLRMDWREVEKLLAGPATHFTV